MRLSCSSRFVHSCWPQLGWALGCNALIPFHSSEALCIADIVAWATHLGIDLEHEWNPFKIAEAGIKAPIPVAWCANSGGVVISFVPIPKQESGVPTK